MALILFWWAEQSYTSQYDHCNKRYLRTEKLKKKLLSKSDVKVYLTSPANQPSQNLEEQRFLNIEKPKCPNQEHKNTLVMKRYFRD
jgi:hypothetical protein